MQAQRAEPSSPRDTAPEMGLRMGPQMSNNPRIALTNGVSR
jgi:hypothetical protein